MLSHSFFVVGSGWAVNAKKIDAPVVLWLALKTITITYCMLGEYRLVVAYST